jgi:hypothetical protein
VRWHPPRPPPPEARIPERRSIHVRPRR